MSTDPDDAARQKHAQLPGKHTFSDQHTQQQQQQHGNGQLGESIDSAVESWPRAKLSQKQADKALFGKQQLARQYHKQHARSDSQHADVSNLQKGQSSFARTSVPVSNNSSTPTYTPFKVQPGRKEDLLIVMPSSIDRMPIVAASRGWRKGVKTYVAFEQQIDLATAPRVFQVLLQLPQSAVLHHNMHIAHDTSLYQPKLGTAAHFQAS